MLFFALLFVAAVLSGTTASLAGFGIGSVLTPLLATRLGTPLAVVAVTIPHAIATALRCWRLRHSIDTRILREFGILSAIGGLTGALVGTSLSERVLTIVLGLLLLATSATALTNWSSKWNPRGPLVWLFGLVSGFFGGIAGNQGGLRSAALLSWHLPPAVFVATATATGLMVDAARAPIYMWRAGSQLSQLVVPVSIASVGVLIGTIAGERVLMGLSPERFRQLIGVLIGALGVWLLSRGVMSS
ncbi:MAG: sulfite exporter TauE/SafE family protein [bacterium]